MRCLAIILTAAVMLAAWTGSALGQSAPTSQPAEKLVVTVKEVSGTCQKRLPGQDKWIDMKPGDKLDELTVICTGFSSRCVLAFADNSTVVIDRASTMGIAEFRKQGNLTKTTVGLKYGAVQATVEKARGPNDFRVSMPQATAAVSGSGASIAVTGDFGMGLRSASGNWNVNMGAQMRTVSNQESTNGNLARAVDLNLQASTPVMAPPGLTNREQHNMLFQGGGRTDLGFAPAGTGVAATIEPPPAVLQPRQISLTGGTTTSGGTVTPTPTPGRREVATPIIDIGIGN